jgi:hypothetical protein
MALSCNHNSCVEVNNKADIEEHRAHLEPSEHEHLIGQNLNGIAVKIEGDELAELPDGLRERLQLEMGRVAKFGRNLGHDADFVAVKKQF